MFYRILTKNGVDNTNIDGARNYNFNAGRRSGIVKGALNQGNFFASSSNTIVLDTCELRLCGHRIVIDEAKSISFHNQPSVPIRYSLVAQIIVDNDGSVSFDLHAQTSSTALVQDNLDTNGSGTYELEIGRFTQLTDGTITDVVRTADLITGGAGGGDSEYIRIGTVTTNKISPELDADVDIENTINPDDNKPQTNFTFNLPTPSGTVVSVAGEEKTSINTDTTPTANSQNLVTSGGVHDYPAITFAESERQKSKNLFDYTKAYGFSACSSNNDGSFNVNIDNFYYSQFQYKCNVEVGKSYKFSAYIDNFTSSSSNQVNFSARLIYTDGTGGENATPAIVGQRVSFTLTPQKEVDYILFRPLRTSEPATISGVVSDIQIEEGTVATDYQPYNGAIVHEKEIADVEHIKTIYDMSSSDSNINKGFTSGIQFDDDASSTSNQINVDTTQYSHFIVTCKSKMNFYSGICNKQYTTVVGSNLYQGASVVVNNLLITDTYIRPYDCYQWISSWTSCKNNNDFVVTKIMGVK